MKWNHPDHLLRTYNRRQTDEPRLPRTSKREIALGQLFEKIVSVYFGRIYDVSKRPVSQILIDLFTIYKNPIHEM